MPIKNGQAGERNEREELKSTTKSFQSFAFPTTNTAWTDC